MGQLREFLTSHLAAGKVAADPEIAAATLMALADGLAAHVFGGFLPPETAEAALELTSTRSSAWKPRRNRAHPVHRRRDHGEGVARARGDGHRWGVDGTGRACPGGSAPGPRRSLRC
ncbi:MAG: hypothetical protein ACT4NP_15320 [Pseudonocardiales bacterium]